MRSRNNCMIRLRLRNTSFRTCKSSNQPQMKSLSARRPIEPQPEGAERRGEVERKWDTHEHPSLGSESTASVFLFGHPAQVHCPGHEQASEPETGEHLVPQLLRPN